MGVVIEVNAETDFVAKNADFQAFVKTCADTVIEQNPADVEALLACKAAGTEETVDALLKEKILTIGENIKIRRFARYEGDCHLLRSRWRPYWRHGEVRHHRRHRRYRGLQGLCPQRGHADCRYERRRTWTRPPSPPSAWRRRRKSSPQQIVNEGKPQNIAEKIVAGRLNKFFKEICLVDQVYVQDSSMTVKQYTESVAKELGGDIKIAAYTRFEKGEGLEKRQDDFAAEVAGMVK